MAYSQTKKKPHIPLPSFPKGFSSVPFKNRFGLSLSDSDSKKETWINVPKYGNNYFVTKSSHSGGKLTIDIHIFEIIENKNKIAVQKVSESLTFTA